ncbi:hypothetical protein FRX31_008371, partial [Thalictrum thalictroides]
IGELIQSQDRVDSMLQAWSKLGSEEFSTVKTSAAMKVKDKTLAWMEVDREQIIASGKSDLAWNTSPKLKLISSSGKEDCQEKS